MKTIYTVLSVSSFLCGGSESSHIALWCSYCVWFQPSSSWCLVPGRLCDFQCFPLPGVQTISWSCNTQHSWVAKIGVNFTYMGPGGFMVPWLSDILFPPCVWFQVFPLLPGARLFVCDVHRLPPPCASLGVCWFYSAQVAKIGRYCVWAEGVTCVPACARLFTVHSSQAASTE